jgi:membrane protein implicated in regulation of membrane protease activity
MHGVLAALAAAEEIDPATVRPSPLASVLFLFLLAAMILLLWSFVRHLRRAQSNLGSARTVPGAPASPGTGEGDSR